MRYFVCLFILFATTAAPASAQIYSWRDATGLLVVSDRPRGDGGAMATYAAPAGATASAAAPRATKPLRVHARAAAFADAIHQHATANGVSPDLVRAVIQVESAFNPQALSPKGAMGLMQLMPATARELGVHNPFLPEENIRGGVLYLRRLLDRYDGNVELALAAYNAGPGSVEKYGAVPPYRETQAYVKKVTGVSGPAPPVAAAASVTPDRTIYKWVDGADGHQVVRYSNRPPGGVDAAPVGRR